MRKTAYIKAIIIFSISILLYWCWVKINNKSDEEFQIEPQIIENKFIKKYNSISSSGNIYENLEINIHWVSNDLDLNFDIASKTYKNIDLGSQKGYYMFQMISKKESFDEVEIISWFVDLISNEHNYFVIPKEISFSWPKGKHSNKEIEEKIADIKNHWIKIDKEIPFKTTSESIFKIQKLLRDLDKIEFNNQSWYTSVVSEDGFIDGKLSSNTWLFYLSSGQLIQIYKDRNKFKFHLSWHESDTNLDIKIKNWLNNLTLKFKWNIAYKHLSPLSSEIKLDIKWKYVIKTTWYIQMDLPTDYLNLTQTSLTKK